TDIIQRLHDRRPMVVALQKAHRELLELAVLLDVQLEDALTQDGDPSLGWTIPDGVADVEMPAYLRTINGAEEIPGLLRSSDEIVPDVLDGDFHTEFFGMWHSLLDLDDRALETIFVGNLFVDNPRDEKHRTCAVALGVSECL